MRVDSATQGRQFLSQSSGVPETRPRTFQQRPRRAISGAALVSPPRFRDLRRSASTTRAWTACTPLRSVALSVLRPLRGLRTVRVVQSVPGDGRRCQNTWSAVRRAHCPLTPTRARRRNKPESTSTAFPPRAPSRRVWKACPVSTKRRVRSAKRAPSFASRLRHTNGKVSPTGAARPRAGRGRWDSRRSRNWRPPPPAGQAGRTRRGHALLRPLAGCSCRA